MKCTYRKTVSCECCGTNIACTHPERDGEHHDVLCYKDEACVFTKCPVKENREVRKDG